MVFRAFSQKAHYNYLLLMNTCVPLLLCGTTIDCGIVAALERFGCSKMF